MSGRAGRTGFDTRGDSVMICKDTNQLNYTRDYLLKPFKAKLSSALQGTRLVKAILEVIASQAITSFY